MPASPARPQVEESLRRRERALAWGLSGALALAVLAVLVLALLAVPLVVIAFPLTLSALAILVLIGRFRRRKAG